MNLKKFLAAIIFTALISVNTCYAWENVAVTPPDSESWVLALMKDDDNDHFFFVINMQTEQGAMIPYRQEWYNFYLKESPVIFIMAVSGSPHDVDANFGEWSENGEMHLLPVYALFNYANGQVTLDSDLSSGVGLQPSHYQGSIKSPYHKKLAEIFLTRMPDLHKVVESQGISLP